VSRSSHPIEPPAGVAARIVALFIDSKLTPLVVIASVLLGAAAVVLLPREEEPQIVVPMVDVFVQMPAASAAEVEQRVTRPLEKLLWEIPGVEYLYSTSSTGQALVIVRFEVGHSATDAIVKLNAKIAANLDRIPPGVSPPLVKVRSIDDVPILALTLSGPAYDHAQLRRLGAQLEDAVKQVPEVSETTLIGGLPRRVRVVPNRSALAARGLALTDLVGALQAANQPLAAGSIRVGGDEVLVETGAFLRDADAVTSVVVGVHAGRPVRVGEIAAVLDGPDEPDQYVFLRAGAATAVSPEARTAGFVPAVTLAVAKRQGTNAIAVANRVLQRVESLRGSVIPADVQLTVTRHYGRTAEEKADELLYHMAIAVVSVSLLIALILGWRESAVVAVAIPVTLALTLAAFYLLGFTLNRITLFALIFSIGILVDDPIVDVENIVRHLRMARNRERPVLQIAMEAVNEVRSPLILATFTVMAAILPMAFVRGLMGPYMRPIPIGATAAMLFSMLVAFVVTPWAAARLLAGEREGHDHETGREDPGTRLYRWVMGFLIHHPLWQGLFLFLLGLLLAAALATVPLGYVKVKMLPFDNKSEFQVIIDMPEGTSLERTAAVARELADAAASRPEVSDVEVYAGTSGPYNFNGLVRHYYLRRGANVADLQVNLVHKSQRREQSHAIAKAMRPRLERLAARHGARIKVAEVPPGPPVLQTLVAEVYGPDAEARNRLARQVEGIFRGTAGVVDVDTYIEDDQTKIVFEIDREKAALHGVDTGTISQNLQTAIAGTTVGIVHDDREREDVDLVVRLPEAERQALPDLNMIPIRTRDGGLVPLGELVARREVLADKSIYHKNLMPVSYVVADVAGAAESPAYAMLAMRHQIAALTPNLGAQPGLDVRLTSQPVSTTRYGLKWDGELHITYEVFRDLGLAFAAVLVLIYVLVVGWFDSFKTPFVIMAAIPFSLVGILPAHGLFGAFFSATSMIGFIAGAGIVVRNSIILVDFIELRRREGMPLAEAVVDAGAVRFRPMVLTALAVVVGASVILFDPIFQGLAIALMAGEVASLLLSRMAVPVLYYLSVRRQATRG